MVAWKKKLAGVSANIHSIWNNPGKVKTLEFCGIPGFQLESVEEWKVLPIPWESAIPCDLGSFQ